MVVALSALFARPDYIQYSQDGLERGWFTEADITKLENEPAIFQWTAPRAFYSKYSGWFTILRLWGGIVGIPVLFFSWTLLGSEQPGGWNFVILIGAFLSLVILFAYYTTRFQYHHVAYKITESGFLRDEVKLCPRWGYRAINPEGLMWVLRVMTLILVPMALVIHPFLLVGVGGLALLSFKKVEPSEPEKAHYIPTFWHKGGVSDKEKLSKIYLNPIRRTIHVRCADLSNGGRIFCTKKNYEEVKAFVLKKLPEAKVIEDKSI